MAEPHPAEPIVKSMVRRLVELECIEEPEDEIEVVRQLSEDTALGEVTRQEVLSPVYGQTNQDQDGAADVVGVPRLEPQYNTLVELDVLLTQSKECQ